MTGQVININSASAPGGAVLLHMYAVAFRDGLC